MRIGQTSIVYLVSKVVGSLLGFVATVYFARLLGEEVLGFYSITLAIVAWLAIAGKIGITGAIVKRVSEGEERASYITAGGLMMAGVFVVISSLVLAFRGTINQYVGAPVAVFVVVLVFAELLRSFAFSSLQGHHLVHVYALLATVKMGLRSLAQIGLVVLGWALSGMLVGYAVGAIVVGIVSLWILGFRPSVPRREHFRRLTEFAKFSWLGNMRAKTFDSVDIIVLGFFVPAGLVGIYSVVWSITKFLNIFGSAISTTLFPEISKEAAEDNPRAVSNLVENALAYAGLLLIPGLIGGALVGDRLLLVYGEGFVEGTSVLVILVAALLAYTYTMQLLNTLGAIDRPDLSFRANAVFIVSNLVLNLGLVSTIGWVGAAVATLLSAIVGLSLAFRYTRALVDFSVPYVEIGRQWVAAAVMGGLVYGARQVGEAHWIADYNEAFVVLLVGFGAGAYIGVLLVISSRFRTTVTDNLPFDVPYARG